MKKNDNLVSIVLLTYNSSKDLPDCIPSILAQSYNNFEIIVVDNASTDDTVEYIRKNYPQLKLIETGNNLGYAAGNNVGFQHSQGKYLVIVNPDTVADPQWLTELIKPLEADSTISVTTSKIKMYYHKDRINTCGNIPHYTGLTFCRGLNSPAESCNIIEEIGAISGCSFAIRREMMDYLGGFDADFFLYMEDSDISWRLRFAGGKIVYVPTSIIYHKFNLSIGPWKYFYLERNRHLLLLKNLNTKTLIFLFPGLVINEILIMGYAILKGHEYIKSKFRAYWWIINNRKLCFEKKKKTFALKNISDKEFFRLLEWKIPFEQIIGNKILCWCVDKIFNTFFWAHFKIMQRLI